MPGVVASGSQFIVRGKPVQLRGINIYCDPSGAQGPDGGIGEWGPDAFLTLFKGINIVRLNSFSQPSVGFMQPIISKLTAAGVICEIEDHNYPTCYTGSALQNSANWYHAMAQAFAANDLVIFGTQNEPDLSSGWGAVDTELATIVSAIRGAGNQNLINLCAAGGFDTDGLNTSAIKAMQNVALDLHYYNWQANNSTDLNANKQALANLVARATALGLPPFIGETGISSGALGAVNDPGGNQVVQAFEQANLSGTMWAWTSGNATFLLMCNSPKGNPASGMTAFGVTAANWIAAGSGAIGSGGTTPPVTPPVTQPVTPPTGTATYCWPGVGSVTDGKHTYSVDANGNFMVDGNAPSDGHGTGAAAVFGTTVYGMDAGSFTWYVWNGTAFQATSSPPPIPPLGAPPKVAANVVVNVTDQAGRPGNLTIPVTLSG